MSFSDYLENSVIKTIFHADTYVYGPPGTYYIGLSAVDPGEDASSDAPPSDSANGYARVALDNAYSSNGFTEPVNGVLGNSGTVTFPRNTGLFDWSTMSYFTMWDSLSGGNMLVYGQLGNSKTIRVGDVLKFQPGDLQISLDNNTLTRDLVSFWKMESITSQSLGDSHGSNTLYIYGDNASIDSNGVIDNSLSLPNGDTYVAALSSSSPIYDIDPSRSSGMFKLTDSVAYSLFAGDVIQVTGNSDGDNNTEFTVSADGTGYFFDTDEVPDSGTGGSYYLVSGPSHSEGLRFKDNNFTVSVWSKLRDKTQRQHQVAVWRDSTNERQYRIMWNENLQRYLLRLSNDGINTNNFYFDKLPVETGEWHHLVATYDADTDKSKLFMDGAVSVTGLHESGIHDNNAILLVGAQGFPSDTSNYSYGDIDEVGVWRRLLSNDEVSILYGGGTGIAYNNFDNFDVASRLNISNNLVTHWDFDSAAITGNAIGANQYDFASTGTINSIIGINGGGTAADFIDDASNSVYIESGRVGLLSPGSNNFSFSLWLNGTIFKDIISAWSLGEDIGKDVDDYTSNDLDLRDVNSSVLPSVGVVGSGSYFNGTTASYSVEYSSGVELRNMSDHSGLTVATWAFRQLASTQTVTRLHGSSTKNTLWFDTTYKFGVFGYNAISTQPAPLNTWEYLVGRWDGGSGSISINASGADYIGVTAGSDDSVANFDIANSSFNGRLDEVGVWGRPITETEISYLYNGGVGKNLDSLVTTIFKLDGSYELKTSGDRFIFSANSISSSTSVTGVAYLGRPGWKHVVCNVDHDENTISIYVNGQKTEAANTLGSVRNHTGDFELASAGVLSLRLDEMSYWHGRSLGYDDVLGLYNFGDGHDLEWILEN